MITNVSLEAKEKIKHALELLRQGGSITNYFESYRVRDKKHNPVLKLTKHEFEYMRQSNPMMRDRSTGLLILDISQQPLKHQKKDTQ